MLCWGTVTRKLPVEPSERSFVVRHHTFIRNYRKAKVRCLALFTGSRLCNVFDALQYFQHGGPFKSIKEEIFEPSD
jgi:hypothetical protein